VMTKYHATVSIETIEVLLPDQFTQPEVGAGPSKHHG
jgi:hypothetical protein